MISLWIVVFVVGLVLIWAAVRGRNPFEAISDFAAGDSSAFSRAA